MTDCRDPLSPPAPSPPYFDLQLDAWVFTRYADVLAAFREPKLWPAGARGEDQSQTRDPNGRSLVRDGIQDAISPARLVQWESLMKRSAAHLAEQLPEGRTVDLLACYMQPWCLDLAMLATGAREEDRRHLAELAGRVIAGTGQPEDSPLREVGQAATAELERIFQAGIARMGEPTFVGVSQTLPRLLANALVALLRHPGELARLRDDPALMPRAVDELLRYAGIIPKLLRHAVADVEIAEVRISTGQRVNLMLSSANRDPEQFSEPDRLDLTRRAAGHVTLGSGRNSCVGAPLIRMAATVTIGPLLARFSRTELSGAVEWQEGAGFAWPAAVPVLLFR